MDYAEGIYIGYKWYETADAEGYWSNVSNEYGTGYDGVVQYPFGYGLSYTSFDWAVTDAAADGSTLTKDGDVTVKVTVTNTGDRAARMLYSCTTPPRIRLAKSRNPALSWPPLPRPRSCSPARARRSP